MTEELPWEFGQMLTSAIERTGLSRREIARRAGVSAPTVINLEAGFRSAGPGVRVPMNPAVDTVVRIATVLKMPLRKALELAGLADKIPEGMSDQELQEHFSSTIDDMLDDLPVETLLNALRRRVGDDDSHADR